jgi:hypothetical protein
MRHERDRQCEFPIDVSKKRSEHIGEQHQRQPFEDPRNQLVRSPEQEPENEQRKERDPDQRADPSDELRRFRHTAEISADVNDVGDNENRAGAP